LAASSPPERKKKHADFAKKIEDRAQLIERLRHAGRKKAPIDFCQKIGIILFMGPRERIFSGK
jgi:hypothetical protein